MKFDRLCIDQLTVRVTGLTVEQGREVAEAVSRHLAELNPRLEPRRIDSLSVCVRCEGSSPARIASQIVRNIRRSLE
jgi:hypothetical protein